MTYTSRDRDRGRLAVAAVTGLGAVGALTTTGWLAGVVAADFAAEQATSTGGDPATEPVANRRADRGRPLRERPYVTRVTVRYVPGAASVPVAPASGGSVTSVAPVSTSSSSSGSTGGSSGPSGSSSSSGSSGSSGSGAAPAAPSSGS